MAKRGRPSKYTPKLAAEICRRLAEGEALTKICKTPGMPSEACVRLWVLDDAHGFSSEYARARDVQADHHADLVLTVLSETPHQIETVKADGTRETKDDPAHVAWLKNKADGLKWHAGQVRPKKWGNKLDVNADVKIDIGSVLDAARKRVASGSE